MTARLRATAPYAFLGVLLSVVLVPLLAAPPALAGRTVVIELTANGPQPASTTAMVGDIVRFTNADMTFVHEVRSKSANWAFDSKPLAPGSSFETGKLTKPGEYDYEGANLDTFTGKVVVPSGTSTAAPAPSPSRSAAGAHPSQPASSAPTAGASASASATAGPGLAVPPVAGGYGAIPVPGATASSALAPAVAPTLPGEDVPSATPSGGATVAIANGRLPEPPTGRRYGLPAALAAVAAAGVASLLVRLLLAHPAARRAEHAGGGVAVSVD